MASSVPAFNTDNCTSEVLMTYASLGNHIDRLPTLLGEATPRTASPSFARCTYVRINLITSAVVQMNRALQFIAYAAVVSHSLSEDPINLL